MAIDNSRKKLPPFWGQRSAPPPWHRCDSGGDRRFAEEAFEIARAARTEPSGYWRHLRQVVSQFHGLSGDVVRQAVLEPAKPPHRRAEIVAAAQREIGQDADPFDDVGAGRDRGW